MSEPRGIGVDADADADAGGTMHPPVEVFGTLPSFPVVDPVGPYVAPVSPYPTIVDPFKRRSALREYFRGLRGENKENERVEGDVCVKSPPSVPKQKTLGLCRRHHVVSTTIAVSNGGGQSSDGMLRDKRKFNAPRQTPEKRQRPVESDLTPEVPRRLDVVNQFVFEDVSDQSLLHFLSREHVELEPSMGQVPVKDVIAEIREPQMSYARANDVSSSTINRQAQDPQSLSFKRQEPKTPTIRKPLAPVNINRQQPIQVHTSPVGSHLPLKPNFSSGGMDKHEGSNISSESLFQLASGKRYQPSAAAKARAASLFESDAELADLLDFE